MSYLHAGVLKSASGKRHISRFPAGLLQNNLPGHIHKCIVTIYAITLCGLWHDLSSLSFLMSFLISPLPPEFSLSFSLSYLFPQVLPNEVMFVTFFGHFSFFSPALSSLPLAGRQLWIIKWWIRGYFLPTQTCGDWAGILAVDFIPLSSRNASKSHCCPSSLSRKRVESPLIPVLVPRQDQRGLDAAGRNSCSNKKQQYTSVDEFLPAAANLAACVW